MPAIEVDLHLHTTFSDGTLTPTQLIALCVERGLKTICISDHDTTNGLPEAFEAAAAYPDLAVIPGIELSTDVPGSEIHILGYFVDHTDASLQAILEEFRGGREDRGRKMVENLNEHGTRHIVGACSGDSGRCLNRQATHSAGARGGRVREIPA